ncbi:TetR/AcrR family transcriptional regulator [Paracoccus liaowanqingii]|uniref:TetR/AcrR family transcriptional regulator n=1 Tax=Paracoccus liaowanqingii TaxID=2560053 RepID=A0A4P7HM13_9RHOB|nr:TetR/AcrR family transcriptional regulator [Paracoccus liaowanqingii]QBX34337.1 TetR/AcrR family transcriptional regulator [Paracoccus liaowanqingii]
MKTDQTPFRKPGRPLSFDREAVLEKAMLVFWSSGYETTSVADLTAAMGVTAPSLYAAFGSKQRLFLEAMRRYVGDPALLEQRMMQAPTAKDAVEEMLSKAAVLYTGASTPPGCLLASAAATGSEDAAEVRAAIAAERRAVREIILRRISADTDRGLPIPRLAPGVLADLVVAVLQGMSVLARDGGDRTALLAVAEAALQCWETCDGRRQGPSSGG